MENKKQKGQVEAFAFTVIFLAIALAVIVAAVVALIGARGQQLKLSGEAIEGTTRPMAFAEGSLRLEAENASVLEQALQLAVIGRIPAAYGRVDRLPLTALMQDAVSRAGFGEAWRFTIASSMDANATPILELGTFPRFCGEADTWAWCEEYSGDVQCSLGRAKCVGIGCDPGKCLPGQRCCQLFAYNFADRKYDILQFTEKVESCGPDKKGWSGLCKAACAPGEVEVGDGANSACPPKLWGILGKQPCCRPAERLDVFEPGQLDVVALPLLYAEPDGRNVTGKMEIWLGVPETGE